MQITRDTAPPEATGPASQLRRNVRPRLAPSEWSIATWLHWALRIGVLWQFVGHGAFGIMGKEGWLPYYNVFGISDSWAFRTMPLVGAVDIAVGVLTLVWPMRAVLVY